MSKALSGVSNQSKGGPMGVGGSQLTFSESSLSLSLLGHCQERTGNQGQPLEKAVQLLCTNGNSSSRTSVARSDSFSTPRNKTVPIALKRFLNCESVFQVQAN